MESNALAVDRLQENRELWFQAGGCDPDLLRTPNEALMDQAEKTVQKLDEMLAKAGPSGGLNVLATLAFELHHKCTDALVKAIERRWLGVKFSKHLPKYRFSYNRRGLRAFIMSALRCSLSLRKSVQHDSP